MRPLAALVIAASLFLGSGHRRVARGGSGSGPDVRLVQPD